MEMTLVRPDRQHYFRTSTEFLPVPIRQRDHAQNHGQPERANLFKGLIDNISPADA